MSPPFRGAMIALVAIAIVVAGAWMTVWAALALHAGAVGAGVVQGLLQRRFGEGVGLPGIRVLTIATAFACSTALIAPLDAWLWWPFAVACAAAAALLVLAPAMALCDWAGLREPPARVSGAPGLSGPFPEDRGAADPWFDLGNTGCRARITVVGELGMGGPQTLAYTLDNGLQLPGEGSATSDDGRWWILRQDHGGGCFVVDVSERVVYAGEGMATGEGMLAAGVLSAATLIAKGFSPRRYRLLPGGWWWPESEPDPPLGPRPLGPDDGEAMLQLTRPIIDRTRVLEAHVPLAYLAAPEWAVADARGPLPLRLPASGLDGVVWRADGKAALLPVASLADGSPAPASWYLWRADASGAWFEPGRPGGWGIPGASPTRPVRLEAEHVWLCVGVGVELSAGLEGWDSLSLDSTMTFGSMHWPLAARADGSIDHVDVPVSLHLRLRQSLTAAPDAVAIDAIEVDLPGDRVLGFVPEGPRHAALRPGEVRSFRCRFEGGELSGIAPLPRPLGSGRFVVLQAVDRGALASRLHLVDLDTGRVSVLERPVAALRPVASLGDTLAWVEVLGQRSAHARFDALQALRPVPPPGAWGGTHADEGCTLVLRPRRACLEPSACELRLRPPWTRVDVPVSPLQPGDVEYHPPAALPVLVFGVSNRWRDPWAREQEPRHSGRLLTAEGHAIDEVAQGLIGSEDGRWLLFARRTVRDEVESLHDRRVTDWEIALLDRAAHRLHVRRGEHFGGLPFFRAFEGDRIVFDTSPEPWWRPELPRASHTWSLEAVLERLDARPLVQGDGLWRLPDDRTPVARWQALQTAWQAGDWPA